MSEPFDLVAIVPVDKAPSLLAHGWRAGRTTLHVCTLTRRYATADEAMRAGRNLKHVWAVEPAE